MLLIARLEQEGEETPAEEAAPFETESTPQEVTRTEEQEVAQTEEVVPETAQDPALSLESFSEKMQETVAREAQEFFTTRFAIDAPGAKSVYVTGSFNDWSLDDGCRLKEMDGQWEVYIPLKTGFYKYQFIVDGVWKEDPNNSRRERNSFGDINSLIEVNPEPALEEK